MVASVLGRSVILIFIYVTISHAQIQIGVAPGGMAAFPSGNLPDISSYYGLPRFQTDGYLPLGGYAENPNSLQMSMSGLPPSVPYAPDIETRVINHPKLNIIKSLMSAAYNMLYFVLGSLDLSDADRHLTLRTAADNSNAILDAIQYYVRRLVEFALRIHDHLTHIPVLGIILHLATKFVQMIDFLPMLLVKIIKKLCRSIFDGRPQISDMPGLPYPYL